MHAQQTQTILSTVDSVSLSVMNDFCIVSFRIPITLTIKSS